METEICVVDEEGTNQSKNRLSAPSSFYTVDSFANGIAFGQQKLPSGLNPRDFFSLRLRDDTELIRLRSRYALHKENPLHELELHLMRLSKQGALSSAVIYFGTTTDPFFPFEGKFDASIKFLELFKRYTPGLLVVQTRSPLLVIAMPVLKKLGNRVAVTLGVETIDENIVRKYTPGLPKASERLQCARALRRFGIEVTLQVAPLLPYGDWKEDAGAFADSIVDAADYIHVKPLCVGKEREDKRVSSPEIARALSTERKFHWLRHDAAVPLLAELEERAPQKLIVTERKQLQPKQMEMFAA